MSILTSAIVAPGRIADEQGNDEGYDIESFETDGAPRLVEVKTTRGWERTPFHVSRNELRVSRERGSDWLVFRLWNFGRGERAFELRPPLEAHLSLTATSFEASFD